MTYESGTAAGVAVDETYVYWTDNEDGYVCKMPLGGGDVTTLAIGVGSWPLTVAVDDAYVYWSGWTGIERTPK